MSYQIEPKAIVHECVDGEVVIVNFANGNYYSLIGVSAFIWEILSQGPKSEDKLCSALLESYQVENDTAKKDLYNLLAKLLAEGLIVEAELEPTNATSHNGYIKNESYLPPTIEIHSDMREVIVLDPVHEVEFANYTPTTNHN